MKQQTTHYRREKHRNNEISKTITYIVTKVQQMKIAAAVEVVIEASTRQIIPILNK